MSANLTMLRGLSAHRDALAAAVGRVRSAAALDRDQGAGAVHAALTEATNWLAIIAEREPITGDSDVQALLFARHRAHHQFASVVENDGSGWTWRPAESLPTDPAHPDKGRRPMYEQRLARKPLLDVFDRLTL